MLDAHLLQGWLKVLTIIYHGPKPKKDRIRKKPRPYTLPPAIGNYIER